MKALLELKRIAITHNSRTPPPRAAPRRERRKREREQLRQMKRTALIKEEKTLVRLVSD